MEENDIGLCRVLCQSPFDIFGRPDLQQSFWDMLKNILAPKYRFWSITTLLIFLPIVLYIVLAIINGSFLKLPYFAVQNLVLTPFRLKQFQFYRLYSAPFVFMDLNETLFNSLMVWIVGSHVEDIFGWKIIVVFIGLPGLVGASCSITFILIGLFCTNTILDWAGYPAEIIVRRLQIIIYFVALFIFFLFMLSQERSVRIAIYSSILYGFLLGFIVGHQRNRQQKSFDKLSRFMATLILISISTFMIMGIVFYHKTIV